MGQAATDARVDLMVFAFADVDRSTERAEVAGFIAVRAWRVQLERLTEDLVTSAAGGNPVFAGERQGDGRLIGMPASQALPLLDAILRVQHVAPLTPGWLPMKIAIGLGTVDWRGDPFAPGSTFDGRDVTICARLKDECPPGGVIINQKLWELIYERAPHHRRLFTPAKATIRGIEEPQACWIMAAIKTTAVEALTPVAGWLRRLAYAQLAMLGSVMLVIAGSNLYAARVITTQINRDLSAQTAELGIAFQQRRGEHSRIECLAVTTAEQRRSVAHLPPQEQIERLCPTTKDRLP